MDKQKYYWSLQRWHIEQTIYRLFSHKVQFTSEHDMAFCSIRRTITFASKNFPVLIPKNYLNRTSQFCAAGVDDQLFGLNESQQELRQTVYDFCQKELVPYAEKIDKDNGWDQLR